MTCYAYISIRDEDKLIVFRMDEQSGELTRLYEIPTVSGPGPLATDPEQRTLYAGLRGSKQIAAYRIDPASGDLALLNTVDLDADTCYLATDRTGRWLLGAYYHVGKVTVHALDEEGHIEGKSAEVVTAEHAHCIQVDADNRFVYTPHTMPANYIAQFAFDEQSGALLPNPTADRTVAAEGEGPRHFVFHPTLPILYTSNENGSSVTGYRRAPATGTLSPFQTLSTLPEGFDGSNTTAQIHIHPTGRSLYVSNRGHDSIACFGIDAAGSLRSLGQQPSEPTPRTFNLDPAGNFLFAAGQASGRLAAYRVNTQDGTLHYLTTYEVGAQPMWVLLLDL